MSKMYCKYLYLLRIFKDVILRQICVKTTPFYSQYRIVFFSASEKIAISEHLLSSKATNEAEKILDQSKELKCQDRISMRN